MKKKYKVGDKIVYKYHDFDGSGKIKGIVKEVHKDHIIMVDKDGIRYWLDI